MNKLTDWRNWLMNAAEYWETRYRQGGTSGIGSAGKLAKFKAEIINELICMLMISSVIDFGSGDGYQQRLIECESYHGFDISEIAVHHCRQSWPNRQFDTIDKYTGQTAEMVLSLDVIFHLTEDPRPYINQLFDAATRCVVIYSTNIDYPSHPSAKHVRHRRFSSFVPTDWRLVEYIPNRYPELSNSDFYIYMPNSKSV